MIIRAVKKDDYYWHKQHADEPIKTFPAISSLGVKGLVCPDCGADIYAKSNHLGTCFFVLYPGREHTDFKCKALSKNTGKNIKSITHENFDPKKFLDGLIPTEPLIPKTKGTTTGKTGKKIISPEDEDEPKEVDPEEIGFCPSSSIRDIIGEKLHKEDPHLVINNTGTEVKDILIAVPFFKNFFDNPDQLSDTQRVIQMNAYNSYKNDECFIGRIFKYIGKDEETGKNLYTYIYFKIYIQDTRNTFYSYFKKTFRRDTYPNGTPGNFPNYENIFVAGHWVKTEPYRTKDGKTYPMFETTVYDFGKQIYHHNKI